MDDKNIPNSEQQDIQKQNSRDMVNSVGKELGKKTLEAYGVPPGLSNIAANKVANNNLVKNGLNKVADNPFVQKTLGNNGLSNGKLPSLKSPLDSGTPNLGNDLGNTGGAAADAAQSIANTAIKVKKYWPIISAVAPVIGFLLLGIIAVTAIILPVHFIQEKIEQLGDGLDKFINFITGQGWLSSETVFFNRLQDEYDLYDRLNYKEDEFDIPLIAATIHFSTVVNPDSYSYDGDDKNTEYSYDYSNPEIPANQLRSFYIKANNELGTAWSFIPGQQKLIGHLIDTKFSYKCVSYPTGWEIFNPEGWEDVINTGNEIFTDFWKHLTYTIEGTGDILIKSTNVLKLVQLITAYNKEGGKSYFSSELSRIGYELTNDNIFGNIARIIEQSDPVPNCDEKQFAMPIIKKFINYDYYKKYLKENYLKKQPYALCDKCEYKNASEERKAELLNQWIEEIFEQKETYDYLRGKPSSNFTTVYIPGYPSLPFRESDNPNWKNPGRGFYDERCFVNGKKVSETGCPHHALDVGLETGDPIYAVANGKVIATGHDSRSGLYVKIGHDVDFDGKYDYTSSYVHLSKILVANGANIGGGQLIGEAGSTGNSTSPHLHFAIKNLHTNTPENPLPILKAIVAGEPNIFSPLAGLNET